jgi:dipeptidyl aminopeptidase/acylaminoacyl peptidase
MSRRTRRWSIAAAVLAAAGIGLNVLAYKQAYAMTHFTSGTIRTGDPERLTLREKLRALFCGTEIPRPRSSTPPSELGPECRRLTLNVTNGITLGAWYCPREAPSPLVILFHGYTGEKAGVLPEAKVFLELGASVMLVDFRGSGESSETYTTVGYAEGEDVAAAVSYARAHFAPAKLILYGESMGAAAILRAVQDFGVEPDAIIAEAVFDELLTTVRHRFQLMRVPSFPGAQLLVFWGGHQFGFNGFKHNPVDYARSVKCPILFLHGAADPRARLEEARRVFDAVPGAKQFESFPGLRHQAAVVRFREQWTAAVRPLVQKAGQQTAAGAGTP